MTVDEKNKIIETIFNFLKENFIFGRSDVELNPEKSLIDAGIIDSTGILELVMFLEETYDITIEDEELVPENLDTVENMVRFLGEKSR